MPTSTDVHDMLKRRHAIRGTNDEPAGFAVYFVREYESDGTINPDPDGWWYDALDSDGTRVTRGSTGWDGPFDTLAEAIAAAIVAID